MHCTRLSVILVAHVNKLIAEHNKINKEPPTYINWYKVCNTQEINPVIPTNNGPKMNKILFLIFLSSIAINGYCQKPDSLFKKLDSLSNKADSAGKQINNTTEAAYNPKTRITFKSYFILLGSDLKHDFTKPFHMRRREWGKLALFTAGIAAMTFVDEPIQKQVIKIRNNSPGVSKVSRYITNGGGIDEFITLSALGLYGYVFKNEKIKTTTLLASQAYITGAVIESTVKFLSGRTRPSFYDPTGEAEPKFTGPFGNTSRDFSGNRSNSSFPSGHATVAFAAATVYAMEYRSTVWVPIVSYTAASLISLSRITENKHWTTDVLVGAMLGYLSGRQIVNNYHRYAKIKAPGQPKNSVSFNLQYGEGQLRPGLVYHIR